MNKTLVWIIIGIVVVAAIVLIATSGGDDEETGNELPDVDKVQYNAFVTSNDDFSALDEAANVLE